MSAGAGPDRPVVADVRVLDGGPLLVDLAGLARQRLGHESVLSGPGRPVAPPAFEVRVATDPAELADHAALRRDAFVHDQGLFADAAAERDHLDEDPRAVVLVATDRTGAVVGGVRLAPVTHLTGGVDVGWWAGSRLVVHPGARRLGVVAGDRTSGVAAALVRAACAHAEAAGALRFDAEVQAAHAPLFDRLGWERVRESTLAGAPHVLVRWPLDRVQRLVAATKAPLAQLLAPLREGAPLGLGGPGMIGDDGVSVPGSDVIAACDAVLPSLVERDPEWAGWCAVLVNLNDLSAMGAAPVGLLDALGARDASFATRVLRGLQRAATAWGVPVLGGHTQLGVPAALSVTALGRTDAPVRAGGGRPGDALTLTADLGGGWRPGYRGAQWDSTSARTPEELALMGSFVARTRPAAAKDVSMAGLVGTTGMLAEASGCRAVLDVAAVPRPAGTSAGDWFTCFPGFAMITADRPGRAPAPAGPAVSAGCGELTAGAGVDLRWPDDEVTRAVPAAVTGLGGA